MTRPIVSNARGSTGHATAALALSVLLAAPAAFAMQPLVTDDTGTQGAGGRQLEIAVGHDRGRSAGVTDRATSWPLTFTYGAGETLDVYASIGHSELRGGSPWRKVSGMGNAAIGAKWRLHEADEGRTSLAIKPELALPVGRQAEADGLGSGRVSPRLTLIASQAAPFGAVHVNLAYARDRYRDAATNPAVTTWRLSAAPVWDLNDSWKLALDLGFERARSAGQTTRSHYVALGLIHALGKDLDWALGLTRSRDNAAPRTTTDSLTTGLTWRF